MFATNINEARIRYWYLCFSTNKCKDFIKDINCEKKTNNKKKTTKNNEIHTVPCLERTLCFIKIDKFDRAMQNII